MAQAPAGEELRATKADIGDDALAALALEIEAIIDRLKIVGWAQNTDVQNRMRTAIEDELFDFQKRPGVTLPYDALDRIMDQCIDVARRRSARP